MTKVIADLAKPPAGGRNHALNRAAWKLGQWVAAGALDQAAVEAEHNGLVSDPKDGPRPTWATIRSGLSAGLQRPITSALRCGRPPRGRDFQRQNKRQP